MSNVEITFKNKTNKIEAAEIKKGNITIKLKGKQAIELAEKSVDERFNLDKYIENLFNK
jgi:hypothetical protein